MGTKGSDIWRWYGGLLSRGEVLGAWGKKGGRPCASEGGNGRQGSDSCLWNLQARTNHKGESFSFMASDLRFNQAKQAVCCSQSSPLLFM